MRRKRAKRLVCRQALQPAWSCCASKRPPLAAANTPSIRPVAAYAACLENLESHLLGRTAGCIPGLCCKAL